MDRVDEMLHGRDGHRRVLRGPGYLAREARRGRRGMGGIGEDVGEVDVAGGGGEAAAGWPGEEVETV
jgi:hypothetical protein